ncbi:protein PET117 homolog, mitochondrial [Polistes fuscatus]|uniref:protein PET117 homolog, mitochondrial n=1 Tax=Polistes canadensis TaxID=91411 RepID=UPI000718C479|nr:PREDICTED: protein PET117 homolog, mitochondrial [Polistes canadensis]XP_043502853.1 protein PET117 homolog, mitochondrial [Polistes fuscatus]
MSTLAKLTFGTCCLLSGGIIGYVHYKQQDDRKRLHEGVLRDIERQQRRKIENIYILQQQIDLTRKLQKSVSSEDNS